MKYYKIILDEEMLRDVHHALFIYETDKVIEGKKVLFEAARKARIHIDQTAQEIEM